jgi:hypothetical protein
MRVKGMPDDATLRAHLQSLDGPLLHTLLASGPWDTASVGGEEVDIDWLLESQPAGPPPASPQLLPPPAGKTASRSASSSQVTLANGDIGH